MNSKIKLVIGLAVLMFVAGSLFFYPVTAQIRFLLIGNFLFGFGLGWLLRERKPPGTQQSK